MKERSMDVRRKDGGRDGRNMEREEVRESRKERREGRVGRGTLEERHVVTKR